MWYIASFIRGMSIDEAIKQLSFQMKKGAGDVKQVLLEAQDLAVTRHNVEFKSNLWVGKYIAISSLVIRKTQNSLVSAESFCGKGKVYKGLRRHARGRFGRVEYKHVHYFCRLEEGSPPEHFYLPHPQTPEDQLDNWLQEMRNRKVINTL